MLKRILTLILVSFLLSACTENLAEEITFSSWGSITETKILNKIISDFESENPNIKINFIHIPQNYFQKLHLLFASSNAPDVVFINNLYLPLYVKHLEEIEINQSEYYPQSVEALSFDGKVYAVPRDISNFVFYYNKNFVNPPENRNFEEFIKSIKNSNVKFGVSYERDIYWAMPYILTLGEERGLEFYKDLEGKYAPTPAEIGSSTLAQMFLEGKIGYYLSGRWMYPKISESADFSWGIVNFPGTVPADASGWAISKSSGHKAAAMKFINYLSSEKSSKYFAQTGLIMPARIDSSKYVKDSEVFLKAIENSKVMPIDKDYKKNRDKINKELFN